MEKNSEMQKQVNLLHQVAIENPIILPFANAFITELENSTDDIDFYNRMGELVETSGEIAAGFDFYLNIMEKKYKKEKEIKDEAEELIHKINQLSRYTRTYKSQKTIYLLENITDIKMHEYLKEYYTKHNPVTPFCVNVEFSPNQLYGKTKIVFTYRIK